MHTALHRMIDWKSSHLVHIKTPFNLICWFLKVSAVRKIGRLIISLVTDRWTHSVMDHKVIGSSPQSNKKVVSEFWLGYPKCHFWNPPKRQKNGSFGGFRLFWGYCKTQCKIEFTLQSPKPLNFKVVKMALNTQCYQCLGLAMWFHIKTLPKAQRTRGLSSAYQSSNKFKHKYA